MEVDFKTIFAKFKGISMKRRNMLLPKYQYIKYRSIQSVIRRTNEEKKGREWSATTRKKTKGRDFDFTSYLMLNLYQYGASYIHIEILNFIVKLHDFSL